jgi:autotransporter-associated beta strand protein
MLKSAPSSKNKKPKASKYKSEVFIRRLSSWLVLSTTLTLGAYRFARASSIYWDGGDGDAANNNALLGNGLGGTGTWDSTSLSWWNGTAGSNQTWNNGNDDGAVFAGTAGTVTLGSAITAGSLTFNTTGYTVAGTGPLTLAGASTFINVANGNTATISGSLSDSGNLVINGTGNLILSGSNNLTGGIAIQSGTLTVAAAQALGGGSTVTLGSTTGNAPATLLVSANGTAIANAIALAAGGTGPLTIGNTGTAVSTTFTGGVTGTNNLIINESGTTGGISFTTSPINNSGTVTNIGSGTGTTTIAAIGNNVTAINEYSSTSPLIINALGVNSGGTALTNSATSGTTAILTVNGGVTGTGNLVLSNNNSSITNGIQLTTTAINNVGTIINQGAGTSGVLISAPIGSNVTGLIQNSPTSQLTLSGSNASFAGPITIQAGIVLDAVGTSNALGTGAIQLGNTPGNTAILTFSGTAAFPTFTNAINVGGGATATDVLSVTSWNPVFSSAVTLQNSNLTVGISNTGGSNFTFNAGITGNGNVTVSVVSAGHVNNFVTINGLTINGGITFNNAAYAGPGGSSAAGAANTGTNKITGSVGSGVTFITEASNTNPLTISGAITANSVATTLNSNGTALFTVSGGANGTGNLVFNANNTGNFTVSTGSLANTGAITNSGAGTGTTTISAPITSAVTGIVENSAGSGLTVSSTGNAFAGLFTANAGTLTLSGGVASGATLALGGGTFTYSASGTQTLGAVTINSGFSTINAPNGSTLVLGTVTQNPAGLLDFVVGGTGTVKIANSLVNGIVGPWAVIGSGTSLAYVQGGSGAAIAPYTGATPDAGNLASLTSATTNYSYSAAATVAANATANTLQYTGGASTTALGTNSLTLNGLMNSGTGLLTISGTAGNPGVVIGANGELDIISGGQGITISAVVSGNGNVVYGGPGAGTLTLSGTDTYNGTLNVDSGTVTITGAQSASGVNIYGGTVNAGIAGALGAGTVTLGNSANAVTLNAVLNGLSVSNPIVLGTGSGVATIGVSGTAISATYSGGVTGTGNLTIGEAATSGAVTFSTKPINNIGTVTNTGAGTSATVISGGIGANVTSVTEASNSSALNITGALAVNSAGTTLTASGTGIMTVSGGVTGTGNLVLNDNAATASGITISGASVNDTGAIINSGTGAGSVLISAGIGSNVTGVTEASSSSALNITGALAVNSAGTTLTASGTGVMTVSGGITGTGNLVLNDNAATANGITLSGASVNNTGAIINSGTGTGNVLISAGIGSNVTSVFQAGVSPFTISSAFGLTATNNTLISSGSGLWTFSGGITGSQNLVIDANSTGGITFSTTAINNAGSITNAGTSTGAVTISGGVGSNVTSITENGSYSPLTISGAITVNSGGTTLTNNSATAILTASGGITGTGNLTIDNNNAVGTPIGTVGGATGGITIAGVNNTGTITNAGTGTGAVYITGAIGSSVTAINQNSTTSALVLTGGTAGSGTATISIASGAILQLGNQSANNLPIGTGAITDNGTLIFAPGTTALTYTNAISGTGSVAINSPTTGGTITLSGSNTYSGGTIIEGGAVVGGAAGAFGTGSVAVYSGLNTALTETVANALSGANSLAISGGTVTLSQTNSYYGGTTLSGLGTLNVTVAGSLPGNVAMNGGTLVSSAISGAANTGTITQSGGLLTSATAGGAYGIVVANSGALINPGGQGVIGNGALTIASLTTTSGATLQFDIITPWSGTPATTGDLLNLGSASSIGAGTNLSFYLGNPVATGDYRLIAYSGAVPTLGNFVLPTAPTGVTYNLSTSADTGYIDLVVSGTYTATNDTWTQSATGTYSWNGAANWTPAIPSFAGDIANFGTLASSETVTLDGPQHVGTLNLNPTGSAIYTISTGTGGILLLDNGASDAVVTNTSGNNVISAPVILASGNSNFNIATGTNLTLSGVVSGPGGITVANGGASGGSLTLSTTGTNTFTGPIVINAGSLIFSTATQLSNVPITLNGGTLNNVGVSVTMANPSITVLGGGGTLTVSGAAYTGKILLAAGTLQGSGNLTKAGTGDIQMTTPQPGFSGNWTLSGGDIESQAPLALGTGSITVNTGTDLDISNGAIYGTNPITLNAGGQLSAEAGNVAYGGSVAVTGAASIGLRNNWATNSAGWNFSLAGALTGSGNITLVGSTTTTTVGMFVPAGSTSGYTGTAITVAAQTALGLAENGGSNPASGAIGATPNALTITVNSGGYLGLVADGDGTSTPSTITYTPDFATTSTTGLNTVVFSSGNSGYIVGHSGATGTFNQAANKIISYNGILPANATNTYAVTPENGYSLQLNQALTASTTYTVNGTQASNVNPGLILTNLSTGNFTITKTGTGTLQFGASASDTTDNSFGSATANPAEITATAGTVSAFADANLGLSGNGITLNNAEFLALNGFNTARTITIASATGATIGVASAPNDGGAYTLTLSSPLVYSTANGTLTKVEDGALILGGAVSGAPTGGTNINAGALVLANSNRLGSGTITLANSIGAALQLNGATGYTQALSLSSYGIQGAGALENTSGTNTYSGAITIANPAAIGVDGGTTLNISNTITLTGVLNLVGSGNGTISSAFSGTGGFTVFAPNGTWNITAANSSSVSGAVTVDAGTLNFNGAGTNGGGNVTVNYGATLIYDDTGSSNVANRNAGHTNSMLAGMIELLGANNATSTETFSGFSVGRGEDVVNAVANGATGQANITLTSGTGSFTHSSGTAGGASVVFEGTNLGSATGPGVGSITIGTGSGTAAAFQGAGSAAGTSTAPVINKGLFPWALAVNTTTGATTFATADSITGLIRNLNAFESIGTFGAISQSTVTTNGTTTVAYTSTSGLVIGETVYGQGIPSGATITAINPSVSFTLSAAATNSAVETVTFLSTGDNITLGSGSNSLSPSLPSTGTSPNGFAINSLTLGTGASLTLNAAPQTLTIGGAQGGGILALDTTGANVISGGIITVGTGSTNELDIHTPTGVNLTISSNITGGGGASNVALTKGEAGTLTLTGTAFYAGQTVIDSGTLVLGAVGGPSVTNIIQYTNYMELGNGATLNLNGNTQIVTDLFTDAANVGTGLGYAGNYATVIGGTGSSIVLDEDSARTFTGSIQGSVNYIHSASSTSGVSTLTQNNTTNGVVMILGGGLTLNGAGAFPNITGLTINQSTLTLDNNTGSQDLANRIPNGLAITMNGGSITYIGRTQYMSAETLGAVTLVSGANTINSTVQTTGVASAALTLTSLTRDLGATVNFTNTNGTLGTIGTNPTILISSITQNTPAAGAGSILGGGDIVNGSDFAAYNVTYGVGALGTAGYAGYSPDFITSASSGDNILLSTNPGASLGATSINSLKINGASTLTFTSGGGLNLASGGLLTATSSTVIIGNVANNGTLTTSGPELFLYNGGSGTTTVNSTITGNTVGLVKSGSGTVNLGGTNTYKGGTYVDQGTLTLLNAGSTTSYGSFGATASGGTGLTTLGTGGIFIEGGTLTQNAGAVIPTQGVTISGNGVLNLNVLNNVTSTSSMTTAGSNVLTLPNVNGIAVGQLITGTGIPAGEYVTGVNPANDTITITTGTGVPAGVTNITLQGNNTLSSLTFNTTGGSTAPTINANTLLTLTGAITASSINVGDVAVLAGVVSLNNQTSPTITVNPINPNGQNVAPLVPTLNISAALQNENSAITVTGGGVLELSSSSASSNFSGGINLTGGTSLLIGASSTGTGSSLGGPLGSGTLTVGNGSSLLTTNNSPTVANNIVIAAASAGKGGNVTFDIDEPVGAATAETLTFGSTTSGTVGSGTFALPNGTGTGSGVANTTFDVNAPQMTVAITDVITGTNAAITKTGLGTLALNGNNTFDGGITINSGTVLVAGTSNFSNFQGLGTGAVTLNGGQLSLHLNSGSNTNGIIALGNDVNINTALASAFIDINNATNSGTITGNTILMGALNYTGYTGSTAPATVLNITGGNSYGLHFVSTNLSSFAAPVDISVGAGLTLILPGSAFTVNNAPVNVGPGTLILSGASFNTAPVTISGTQIVQPTANGTGYQFNTTGAIALGAGSTLQIVPVVNTGTNPLTNAGYTVGGLQGKYINFTGTGNAIISAAASSIPGAAVLPGQASSDTGLSVRPNGTANATTFGDSIAVYNGLLHINTGGSYTFQTGADDAVQIVIDGVTIYQQLDTSTGGQSFNIGSPVTVNLSSGYHQITIKGENLGGSGGMFLLYGGPDTASNGLQETGGGVPLQAIPLSSLSYQNAVSSATFAASAYGNAAQVSNAVTLAANTSATIDGGGTDLNSLVASLTLGGATSLGGSILTINNLGGQGTIGVLGATTISGSNQEISTGTGTLYLIGGVADGGHGLTKIGAGTLILGASSNFTGAFTISNGFVQMADPAALTTGTTTVASGAVLDLNGMLNVAGTIVLNGTGNGSGSGNNKFATASSTGALMNSNAVAASLGSGSTITIGAASTSIGGYGNIVILGTFNDGGLAWSKVGPDMLTLSGTNNTLTGTGTVAGGILQVGSASALGTGANGITVNSGAALDLNGFAVANGTRTITINGAGIANGGGVSVSGGYGAYNTTLAALFNSSTASAASISGPVALGANSNVGNNLYTGNSASASISLAPVAAVNGDITLAGVVSGAFTMTKVGGDELFLTNGANTLNAFTINEGTIVLNSTGQFTAAAGNTLTIGAGGSLILDNFANPVQNRVGNRFIAVDGYLTLLGNNNTAITETIGNSSTGSNLNASYGQGIITLEAQTGAALTLAISGTGQPFVSTSGTLEIIGTSLGSVSGVGVAALSNTLTNFTGTGQSGAAGTANQAMNPFTIAINASNGTAGFASFSSNTASATSILQPLTVTGGIATLTATDNIFASTALTAATGITSINSLTMLSGGSLTIGATGGLANTMTIQSGGLLVGNSTTTTGINDTIGGAGTLTAGTANTAFYIHVLGGDSLTISSNLYLASGTGLIKGDSGTLVLQGNSTYNGLTLQSPVNVPAVYVNSGTLQLAGGNETLFEAFENAPGPGFVGASTAPSQPNVVTQVQYGATLDLNGTNQVLQALSEGNSTALTGGTIINSNAGTAATLRIAPSSSLTWSGNISGAGVGTLNFVRSGNNTYTINSPQSYTGTSTFEGGITDLVDLGTLTRTSQIDIVRGILRWDNTGYTAFGDRLTNYSNPSVPTIPTIYLDGGAFEFTSRTGAPDSATIGKVVLNSGSSLIQVQTNGGNATLNMGTLTRNVGTDITFSQTVGGGTASSNGSFGSNPNLYFSTAPTLTNGIIGGWAVVLGQDIGQGGTVAQASFATYDTTAGLHGMDSLNETTQGNAGNTFGAGLNTHVTAAMTLQGVIGVTTTTTTNSLTLTSGAFTLSYANATDTLVLQSGGIIFGLDANARSIGQAQGFGNLTTSAGQQELFIHSGTGSGSTVNADIEDNGSPLVLNLDGLNISGGSLTASAITLAGNNTYTGTTYVNGVIANLSSLNANGGTAISSNTIIVSGSTGAGADSAIPTSASIVLQANNQMPTTANVTLLGGGSLNTNGFNTTINNLILTNDGGDGGASLAGPMVLTYGTNSTSTAGAVGTMGGAGVLTINGTISATTVGVTNINNLANVANAFTTPVIDGMVAFSSATPTIYVDPTNVPGQIGLEFNGIPITNGNSTTALIKTGNGVLGIGGEQTTFAGAIDVNTGSLVFGSSNGSASGVGLDWGNTQIVLASGTILDARGLTGTIGSLTGSGTVENYSLATAGTLLTGMDNSNSTFSGILASPFSSALLNVTKIGTGTFTLTGASMTTNNGTLAVSEGVVDVNTTGQISFVTTTLNTGGTLLLDNSGSVLNNRLGGNTELVSQTVVAGTARTFNFAGGQLAIDGGATAVSENLGNVSIGGLAIPGGGVLVLSAAGTAGVNLVINGSFNNQGQGTSLLIMGDGLGTAIGANVATLNAPNIAWRGSGMTAGTTTLRVREDIVIDTSSTDTTFTGTGVGFATADTSGLLRPLNQTTELLGTLAGASNTTNVGLASLAAGTISTTQNPGTLTLESAGGGVQSGIVLGDPWGADGNLLTLKPQQGGVLAQPGNNGINVGELTNGDTLDIHVLGAGVLDLTGALVSTNGVVKADSGTLVLHQPYVNTGTNTNTFSINGGTVRLAGGNNTLFTQVSATVPAGAPMNMPNGTLDLDGNSQLVGAIGISNPLPYAGGTAASPNVIIDNSSSTPVNFISSTGTSSTFSAVIQNSGGGALSYYRQGANTITLTSPSTYTGSSNFAGNVTLQSLGSIANTSAINVNSATLTWDDTGFEAVSNRFGTAPVNLTGGANLTFLGREGVDNLALGAVNIGGGAEVITETNFNNTTQASVLNVTASNLTSSGGGTVNFVSSAAGSTFGAMGGTSHFFVSNAPVLTNNIIGGWAIVNGADFATYTSTQGVGALGSGGSFPGYSTNAITAGGASDNIQIANTGSSTASPYVGITTRTINSLKIGTNFATQITLNSLNDLLTLQSGGLLEASNQAVTITSGKLTAGTTSAPGYLYVYVNNNTTTINSQIVDNSVGGSEALVKSGAGTLTLNPLQALNLASEGVGATALTVSSTAGLASSGTVSGANIPAGDTYTVTGPTTILLATATTNTSAATNVLLSFAGQNNTYSGGTIVDQGTLNLAGGAGTVSVPGNLTIQGGAIVTETTNAGQIATTSNLTLNNNFTLNLPSVANTFNSLTFNNTGWSTAVTLTIPTGFALTLTGAAVPSTIAVNSSNDAMTQTIAGGTGSTLALPASPTITTSGIAQESLVLNVLTTLAGGGLTVNGTGGAVVLGSTEAGSTFAGGVTLTGQSGLIFTTGSTQTSGTVTSGPLGTGTFTIGGTGSGPTIQSSGSAINIANPVAINGNFTYGGALSGDIVNLTGAVTLSNNPTIAVAGNIVTETISGTIGGSGGFTKAGPGALSLTAANSFTGPINISAGLLTQGVANAFGSTNAGADYTVGSTAELNLNNIALQIGSLSGGGIVTNPGATAGLLLTIGGGADATNATFSGALTAATAANLAVTKVGANNQTFSGQSFYTGATTVNGGTLTLANGSSAATTATLADTAITVAAGQTLAISAAGANAGTNNTVNIGNTATAGSGAAITLSAGTGSNPGANFTMQDGVANTTFNVVDGSTFSGNSLTIGGAGTAANAPTLSFDISSTGTSDLLRVNKVSVGASGGNIAVDVIGSSLVPGNTYTLITAASGLGTGLTLSSPFVNAGGHTYAASLSSPGGTTEVLTIGSLTSTLTTAYWGSGVGGSAGTLLWDSYNSGATNWSTTQPTYTEAGVFPAFGTNVDFSVTGASNLNTTLGENFVIESLTFLPTNTAATSVGGANTLTINAAGVNGNTVGNGITLQAGAGAATISASVILGNSQTWTNNSSNLLTVSGTNITGSGDNLTVAGSGNTTISAAIQTGNGGVTYSGTGKLVLSGTNTYTGATMVSSGKTVVSGSVAGNVNVSAGATLASGTNITSRIGSLDAASSSAGNGGTVAPGDTGGAGLSSIGQLNVTGSAALGSLSSDSNAAHLSMEIGGIQDGAGVGAGGPNGTNPGALQYDRLAISGTLNLTNVSLDITAVNGYTFTNPSWNNSTQQFNLDGHIFFLVTGATSVTNTFTNDTGQVSSLVPGTFTTLNSNGQMFAISYDANFSAGSFTGGHDVAVMAIPEPDVMPMLAGSFGLALGLQRLRRRRK